MDPKRCPHCQGSSVQRESAGSEEFEMCLDCGTIVEEVNSLSHVSMTSVLLVENYDGQLVTRDGPKSKRYARGAPNYLFNSTTSSRGKAHGIHKIKEFCQALQLPRDCCDEATSLFKKTYYHDAVYKTQFRVKDVVSAACVYVAARKQEIPLTLRFMAQITDMKLNELAWFYLFVMKVNNVMVPPLNMAALVVKTASGKGLDKKVIEMTQKLLVLCNRAWISQSRQPDTCIPAAIYLCWLASDSCQNIKTPYSKFCSQFKIPFSARQRDVVRMIRDVLKPMAEKIPWITKVDEKTLISELPSIIDHQTSLLKKAFSTTSQGSEGESSLGPPCTKKRKKSVEHQEDIATASEAAKRHKFLHSTSLDDSEFADEVHQYIYTAEEVKSLAPYRRHLESEESAEDDVEDVDETETEEEEEEEEEENYHDCEDIESEENDVL